MAKNPQTEAADWKLLPRKNLPIKVKRYFLFPITRANCDFFHLDLVKAKLHKFFPSILLLDVDVLASLRLWDPCLVLTGSKLFACSPKELCLVRSEKPQAEDILGGRQSSRSIQASCFKPGAHCNRSKKMFPRHPKICCRL